MLQIQSNQSMNRQEPLHGLRVMRGALLGLVAFFVFVAGGGAQSEQKHSSCEGVSVPYDGAIHLNRSPDSKESDGYLVPNTLDAALTELEHMLPASFKESIRCGTEDNIVWYHHGFGTWIRNNWGLWSGGKLSRYFRSFGVNHPDDMSGLILTLFWRRLNGLPIDPGSEVHRYKAYWDARKMPPPFTCPDNAAMKTPTRWIIEQTGPDSWKVLHIVDCDAGAYWVFEKGRGWYKPDAQLRKRIANDEGVKLMSR